MGAGTFRALQGLKMAEVDNSRALAEFRKKLLLHKELDARLKTGKQTDLCVCARVCFSLDKMLLQGLRIDRFSCIPTRSSVFFVFDSGVWFTNTKTGGKKRLFGIGIASR